MSVEGRFQETLAVVCVAIVADRGAPGFEIRAKRFRMMMMMMMMQLRRSIQAKKEEEKIVDCPAGQRNGNRSEKQAEEEEEEEQATEEVNPVEEEAYCLLEIEKDENLRS
ncbi:unnamed protein product [Sphagnum troendelagicum]